MNRNLLVLLAGTVIGVAACGGGDDKTGAADTGLSGTIEADGSSTVGPITQAMAEEFRKVNANVSVPVGTSGTGGGFKRFCAGEIPISDASRPIKDTEAAACTQNNVQYVAFTVATDGIAVVAHPNNTTVTCMTVDQLKKVWEPNSQVKNWSQAVAGHASKEIKLYGPGTNSGT
ncbi:MAG: substrate-binding domain-containing protein, partial [Longimicrobiales bacterium]